MVSPVILINGELSKTIDISDRGLHYGDGLFETIEIFQGQPIFLAQHLARMKLGCFALKIPFPKEDLLHAEIKQLCTDVEQGVIKLMLTRGSGGRGYRQPPSVSVTRMVALHPFPDYPDSFQTIGISAKFCDFRLGLNPLLAGIKHNNRLEQVIARSEWEDEFQEGLMLDINDHVIEGTMTNLFVIKGQIVFTPDLKLSGINGIIRQIIIDLCCEHKIPLKVITMNAALVKSADELFVTNSIIGIWPISQLGDTVFSVGNVTKSLIAYFKEYKSKGGCE